MAIRKCQCNLSNNPIGTSGDPTGVSPGIIDGCQELILANDQLRKYMNVFRENINKGLKKATNPTAIVKCFPTFVQDLPDGTETGKFLALDLGGSNFRVLLIELGGRLNVKQSNFVIPQSAMVGTGDGLFGFIAECLLKFATEHGIAQDGLPLGFTFSFPVTQAGLKVGFLERWTKGFDCPDVVGKDVVQLLRNAIDRRGDLKIHVVAVLNDTTGTLMASAYKRPDTRIGLIIGTGSNACYIEKQENAELFTEPNRGSGRVLINTEMGAFGDDGALNFIRVAYDEDVDANSLNRGKQLHEKMVSGMYLGEIVRLALQRFTKEGKLFGGRGSDALFRRHSLETKLVSEIESDKPGEYTNVERICARLCLGHATEQDYVDMKYVCAAVSRRAAHLISAGMATLMMKNGESKMTIGVDGSLYQFHPHFRSLMVRKIGELVGPDVSFNVQLAEDGSGMGAALVAAVAAKKKTC